MNEIMSQFLTSEVQTVLFALLVGAAGAAGGYLYRKQASEKKIGRTEQYAKNLLEDAQRKADEKKKITVLQNAISKMMQVR